ncbi:MAG: efflux RND transporter permease subunit [Acidobacteriaceae bacterium]|nr:efflux RND transporter permease subunit [Acidobacteriaceae bacterium]MBV9037119.1 efflux RND transporter permease subunit [Acidobacteriaceae bacterium]MBV9306664.1 efflux RND transporter permease subunit [Acidobacteriaceae bacterium]MBV9940065.1 efflux RND transporter permease subunit [Acidobacteriaceae bacterium]
MWIVHLALRRPYTFVVFSVLVLILGAIASIVTPKDIFPSIDIPVVSVVWTYNGLTPDDMEKRVVTICERAMTTTVNDIEHMESESYTGVAVIRVFFQPNAKVELALSQITSIVQTILRALPPGIFPPSILKYDASSVPVLQLGLSGEGLTEQDLYDLGLNFIRTRLATVQGASVPLPWGGKSRQIMVDLDPNALYAKHLSGIDVSNALNAQSLILPAGTARIGETEYLIKTNSAPTTVEEMNELPIRASNGAIVYMKDIGQIRNGFAVQTNVVRENGRRSALLTVLKNGKASTLNIVNAVKKALPRVKADLPPALRITPLFDQSVFVRNSIDEVLREAGIAAFLTALMILLFLGSWRSTLIVCISIPLSILTSICILAALGETINVMTLGGLALAVGILVDDATVEIENTHRNLAEPGKSLVHAILDSASQVAAPALVSTLSICIVFLPVLLLTGAAKYLFTPLAMGVVFAMMASYFLSRTLVPTMMHYLLPAEVPLYQQQEGQEEPKEAKNWIWRVHQRFEHGFEKMRERYKSALEWSLHHRAIVLVIFGIFVGGSSLLTLAIGRDFFPYVDSGQMKLHVLPPEGMRIEQSEIIFAAVEAEIRKILPKDRIDMVLDNIGLPNGGINLAFGNNASISNSDGDILIALKPGKRETLELRRQLRARLAEEFPQETFFFTPANITNQILNFGLPAPIDLQVVGRNPNANYKIAQDLMRKVQAIPGAVDVHIHQQVSYPTVQVNVDRLRAQQIGLQQRDVANSMLISLSGSGQTAPNQWLNPQNGVNYQVVVQSPQYRVDSFDALKRTPVTAPAGTNSQLLANLATLKRDISTIVVDHYDVQPTIDVYADVDRRDLGGVADEIHKIIKSEKNLPSGTFIELRGEVTTMEQSFSRLLLGIGFAVIIVYLLMAVNFQSWMDPFIILMALPGAFSGILWMLYLTQTTFSVPSLMGSIMTIGVATANSILLVVFANDERMTGKDQWEAALAAGYTRLRPVCMTALAMIIGMLPMALAFGEGGEQNAPLGRAVIGGLLVATVGTLFIVPIIYSLLRKNAPVNYDERIDKEYKGEMTPEGKPVQGGGARPQKA